MEMSGCECKECQRHGRNSGLGAIWWVLAGLATGLGIVWAVTR